MLLNRHQKFFRERHFSAKGSGVRNTGGRLRTQHAVFQVGDKFRGMGTYLHKVLAGQTVN